MAPTLPLLPIWFFRFQTRRGFGRRPLDSSGELEGLKLGLKFQQVFAAIGGSYFFFALASKCLIEISEPPKTAGIPPPG